MIQWMASEYSILLFMVSNKSKAFGVGLWLATYEYIEKSDSQSFLTIFGL